MKIRVYPLFLYFLKYETTETETTEGVEMQLDQIIPVEATDYLIKAQFRMESTSYDIGNCHDMIDMNAELSMVSIYDKLVIVKSEGRLDIAASGQEITLSLSLGKVVLKLGGIQLVGKNKVAVVKKLIEANGIIDTWTSDDWETYIIVHNNHLYQIGFHDGDYGLVCSMKPYRPRRDYNEPSAKEYYDKYKKMRTKHQYYTYEAKPNDEVYGDSASGMGSVYTDEIKAQLDEAISLINKVIQDDLFSDERAQLEEILWQHD